MLSKTGLHAIKAMVVISSLPESQYVGAGALAKEIGAPQNYLGKLLQSLTREGLVISQKGAGGGFRIARDPRKTSLYDVVEPIENVSRWTGCFLGRPRCSCDKPCKAHKRFATARKAYLDFLKQTNLADLVDSTTH